MNKAAAVSRVTPRVMMSRVHSVQLNYYYYDIIILLR